MHWIWRTTWAALWAGISGGVASIGQTYLAQDAATRRRVEAELRDRARRLAVDSPSDSGVLLIPSTAAYVVATPGPER